MSWIASALGGAVLGAAAAIAWRAWSRRPGGADDRRAGAAPETVVASGPPWEAAWSAAGDGLAILDAAGQLRACNAALRALTGFDAEALARLDLAGLLVAADRPAALGALEELQAGSGVPPGRRELDLRLLRADGGAIPVRCVLTALPGRPGDPRQEVLVLADAGARGLLEARLDAADRQAALGILAASLTNEIANPLAYLIGNMRFAREVLGPGAATPPAALTQARQALDEAHEGAARVVRVVSDMTALARLGPERREPVDVPAALRAALGLASGFLQARARLQVELVPLPPVLGDPARLGQAFLDLLVDTGQGLPEGRAQDHRVTVTAAMGLDGRVRVELSLAGAAEGVHRAGGGGLARCRQVVESLGGELSVAGGPVQVVTILLPTTAVATRPGPRGDVAPSAPGGRRARILVVDDEPYVGRTLRRLLGTLHDVEVVGSAREALARLAVPPAPEVILCDLLMPGMSGMELHAEVAVRHPGLAERMVFISGGTLHAAATRFLASVPNPVLEKPFDTEALLGVIEERVGRGEVETASGGA